MRTECRCGPLTCFPQVNSWQLRRTCMEVLLLAAQLTSRTALLSPYHSAVYNTGHIKRWCVAP